MKNILIFLFSFFVQFSMAQVPSAFSYQGLLLDVDGYGLENTEVEFMISLAPSDDGSNVYYQEIQLTTTDQNGVFNFNIGEGSILSASMEDVDWLASVPYIGIEYDLSDGQGMQTLGFTQFKSVPFCLHAKYVVCQAGRRGNIGSKGPDGLDGAHGAAGTFGQDGLDGASGPPGLPVTPMLDTPPANPVNGTVYLDNGNNTLDGSPGIRYYNVDNWIDL